MQLAILFWSITALSTYQFEIDRGPFVEVKATSTFQDTTDNGSLGGGLKAGYLFTNTKDFFFTFEVDTDWNSFEREATLADPTKKRESKWILTGAVALYEFYNPFAFRVAAGGGIERRMGDISPLIEGRAGLGYYWTRQWAVYADLINRYLFRDDDQSYGVALSASLQHVF